MPLLTTMIGSYPKPDYLPIPDWFRHPDIEANMNAYNKLRPQTTERLLDHALRDVIQEQCDVGIDVITDGELRRETYYLHLCRLCSGIDFVNYKLKAIRNYACTIATPIIVAPVETMATYAWKEWQTAQALSTKPVKYTLPGPATIVNSITDEYYGNPADATQAFVKLINREILDLVSHGCQNIQLDEPQFVRDTKQALECGIQQAENCFQGVGASVIKTLHMCCGYPHYLDQTDYLKADPQCYFQLAEAIDNSIFDCISLEDAHRENDLTLFEKFKKTTLVLGVIDVTKSHVTDVATMTSRVEKVLRVVPKERLILAPDCGLGFLKNDKIRLQKLRNLVEVANKF